MASSAVKKITIGQALVVIVVLAAGLMVALTHLQYIAAFAIASPDVPLANFVMFTVRLLCTFAFSMIGLSTVYRWWSDK